MTDDLRAGIVFVLVFAAVFSLLWFTNLFGFWPHPLCHLFTTEAC